jgi:hypothetical protein
VGRHGLLLLPQDRALEGRGAVLAPNIFWMLTRDSCSRRWLLSSAAPAFLETLKENSSMKKIIR